MMSSKRWETSRPPERTQIVRIYGTEEKWAHNKRSVSHQFWGRDRERLLMLAVLVRRGIRA